MKRKTTRLIPFYRGKCLPVALMTLALASANVALAQTNPWVGEALPAEGGDFYLFNKAGNGFLLGANTWGTQGNASQFSLYGYAEHRDRLSAPPLYEKRQDGHIHLL